MAKVGVQPFTVCLAKFRFLESDQYKIRPVIVVGQPYGVRQVLMSIPVTSSSEQEPVDVLLQNWRNSGLLKPSVARVHRLSAILQNDLLEEIGSIDKKDQAAIKSALKELLML
ncbi:MAG TPA: type II toxin-antitoxin system PemK/MazF family toxin [Candidatus Saccharimonadales bacterium]|nr:type II toxin-antitoxin system PemK/MazF family toxin [Candidatus Saccharimonadales bacterium]